MTNTRETSEPKKSIVEQIRACEQALTVSRLAKMLSLDRGTVYDHIERGNLPVIRIGTSIRLDPKLIAEWLEANSIP
jgi:excisionase family DNA binding protein